MSRDNGRCPPHNLEAEESLLGAMLLSKDAITATLATGVTAEDFYKPDHVHVFDAIRSLYSAGEPADPVTVADELRRAGLLGDLGGPGPLVSLQVRTPATSSAARYARIVSEHALLRRLIAAAGEIVEEAYSVPQDVGGTVNRARERVASIAAAVSARSTELDRFIAGLITDAEMERRPPPSYLIEGVLVRDSLAVLFGSSGGGKTFAALDWALSVSSGTFWQGRAVQQGPTLFVAAEGSGGLGARIAAWKAHNRHYGEAGLFIHPEPVNLLDPLAAAVVAEVAKELGAVLVVVDTVARSMPGGDENAAKDIGLLVDNADAIRRSSGATVLLVHHAGKDTAAGMRGSSALHAAVATVVECRGGEGRLVLSCAKQKDAAEFAPIHLGLLPCGESCVVSDRAIPAEEESGPKLLMLRALNEVDDGDGVTLKVWREAVEDAGRSAIGPWPNTPDRTLRRWVQELCSAEHSAKHGKTNQARYTITEQGKRLVSDL